MSTVSAPSKSMKMEQAMFIVELLSKVVPADAPKKFRLALELMYKADSFEAHRVISYVLTHMMSDQDNAKYVIEELGLGD